MSKQILQRLRRKISIDGISSLPRAFLIKINKFIYSPAINIEHTNLKLITLGTPYGGKKFFNFKELKSCTIISCGLGEDASFDIEFANKYNANIVIVDPTPRAISHYQSIKKRIGQRPERAYAIAGTQPVNAYDLSSIKEHQLSLERYAIWTEHTKLKFFAPVNPLHVSYSITNFQNNYQQDSLFEHIEVKTTTLESLLRQYSLNNLPSLNWI